MNFLLEVGTEELPNSLLLTTLESLRVAIEKKLVEQRILFNKVVSYTTPRRLTFYIESISEKQLDLHQTIVGPKVEIAYDELGKLTKAGEGFLQKNGVSESALIQVDEKKGRCIAIRREEVGLPTATILSQLIPEVFETTPLKKSMFWKGSFKFLRPIRWIVAMLGDEFLTFSIGEITSGNTTRGIRVFSCGEHRVQSIEHYFKLLQEQHVILDIEKRKAKIIESIHTYYPHFQEQGYQIQYSDELLTEVANLVEYPYPIVATFSEKFLTVPKEMLITTMQVHQRYFPILDVKGELINQFIIIRNGIESSDFVKLGNEKVVQARLADAQFFYEEDLKTSLETLEKALEMITFQKQLGKVSDKIKRMAMLASSPALAALTQESDLLQETIKLCKIDLASKVVNEKEYAYLQGKMGSIYASHHLINESVCVGIREHYLPKFNGDTLPSNHYGAMTSLLDRVDTLVGCFAIGMIPSGSQDPFALRRAAFGIVNIILDNQWSVSLREILANAIELYEKQGVTLASDKSELLEQLLDYVKQRVINILSSQSDERIVKACAAKNYDNLMDLLARVKAVEIAQTEEGFSDFIAMMKRVENILKKVEVTTVKIDSSLITLPAEQILYDQLKEKQPLVENAMMSHDYILVMKQLKSFENVIVTFFEQVMIFVEEEAVRENRCSLLATLQQMFDKMLDISYLG